jgi:hypothetical protein
MHSAHDLLTRRSALDVAAKRARLQNAFHVTPGSVQDAWTATSAATARAGQPVSLGTLELLGDFASLDKSGRRAFHAHLPTPDHRLLGQNADALLERLPRRPA